MIIRCMSGGERHFRHVLTSKLSAQMALIEKRYPAGSLPICENCEKLALWSKNINGEKIGVCPDCGTITSNPITYSEYLAAEMFG